MRVQAQHLQKGDIVGSGEVVKGVSAGTRTSKGKVDVLLENGDKFRMACWGKCTMICVTRPDSQPTTAEEIDASDARYLDEEEND